MQTITQPTVNQQVGQTFAPKKKAVNKTVTPVNQPSSNNTNNTGLLNVYNGGGAVNQSWGNQPSKANDVMTIEEREAQRPTNQTEQKPQNGTPQTSFNAKEYQSNGYSGVQGNTDYSYDPREESLVQNQITGLLDPNSAMMRKAVAQAQGYNASRGLQSSSLGSEVALSSMIDKALPIAQQDASTYATADQTGWNQSFTADQNNLSREHEASMFDKQGKLTTDLQNDQLNFSNDQSNADRSQQTHLQNLQYEQNLSTLDKQAAIQTKRDELMNSFDMSKMDKTYLQDLEKTKITWEHDDAVFTRNLDGQVALEYKNATAGAYNTYLEQVSNIYSNPNMTPAQQSAGVEKLKSMFESQRQQMQIIYSITPNNDAHIDWGAQTPQPAPDPVYNQGVSPEGANQSDLAIKFDQYPYKSNTTNNRAYLTSSSMR